MMPSIDEISLPIIVALFLASSIGILFAGTALTRLAETLARETGMGQAIAGGFLLGATTSLPGLMTSVTSALASYPQMAVANAVGGIAAQTAFLGIADLCHPKTNLEHVAASPENLIQGALLVTLLGAILLAANLPEVTLFAIHPISPLLIVAYLYGVSLSSRSKNAPMWHPQRTSETQSEPRDQATGQVSWPSRIPRFLFLGSIVIACGWLLARSGIAAVGSIGLSESFVGGFFTAVSSSLPELVTSIAAVRFGAYTLAVGGIIGGNAFDTIFVAIADAAYREGSIYHAIGPSQVFILSLAIVMTGILLMGLLTREKRGIANIGFESFGILSLYFFGVLGLIWLG